MITSRTLRQLGDDYPPTSSADGVEIKLAAQLLDNASRAVASNRLTSDECVAIEQAAALFSDAFASLHGNTTTSPDEIRAVWQTAFVSSQLLSRYMPPENPVLSIVTQSVRTMRSKKAGNTEKETTVKRREWLIKWRDENGSLKQKNALNLVQKAYGVHTNNPVIPYDRKTFRDDCAAIENGWPNNGLK
jgi:hypothetical protein